MSYIRYDYSGLTADGAQHGLIYEAASTSRPINISKWALERSLIYAEIEIYSTFNPTWEHNYVNIYGNFKYAADGSLDFDNSTVRSTQIRNSSGSYSYTFDTHKAYSETLDVTNLYDANTWITGSRYSDTIYAEDGNDVINGGGGNDIIVGGNGHDKAIYNGPKSRYLLELSPHHQLTIRDIFNSEGVDYVTGIEHVEFAGLPYEIEALRIDALLNTPAQISNRVSRLFNQPSGKHLFSANQTEIDYLTGGGYGWVNEGTSYLTPSDSTAEVYRFLVNNENRHFYTANQYERDLIKSTLSNFVYEGVAYNVYSTEDHPSDSIAVVRYYNGTINSHIYSTSTYEQNLLSQNPDWLYEGIAWYGEVAI